IGDEPELGSALYTAGPDCGLLAQFYREMGEGDTRGLFSLCNCCRRGSLLCFCRCQVKGQFPAKDIGEDGLTGIPYELIDTPLDTILGRRSLLKREEKFLAVHLVIIDHETIIRLIELPDQVAVVGTEHQKAHTVTYCREVKRIIHLFTSKRAASRMSLIAFLAF